MKLSAFSAPTPSTISVWSIICKTQYRDTMHRFNHSYSPFHLLDLLPFHLLSSSVFIPLPFDLIAKLSTLFFDTRNLLCALTSVIKIMFASFPFRKFENFSLWVHFFTFLLFSFRQSVRKFDCFIRLFRSITFDAILASLFSFWYQKTAFGSWLENDKNRESRGKVQRKALQNDRGQGLNSALDFYTIQLANSEKREKRGWHTCFSSLDRVFSFFIFFLIDFFSMKVTITCEKILPFN